MCIAAWNNRITCSAGHARRKNGTSRGISRIPTPPVEFCSPKSILYQDTHLTSNDAKPIKEGRASPPAAPPVDYALLPEVVVQFKSGRKERERGRAGGRNEMEISHKAWLTSICGGASAFGAAITIFVFAASRGLPQPQLHESFEREPRETGIMRRGAARARSLFSPKDLSNVRRKRRMATTARTAAADLKAFGKGVKRGRGRGL